MRLIATTNNQLSTDQTDTHFSLAKPRYHLSMRVDALKTWGHILQFHNWIASFYCAMACHFHYPVEAHASLSIVEF